MIVYKWLDSCYLKTNEKDIAYEYAKKTKILQDKIDKYKQSIAIKAIEDNSNVEEKNEEINSLNNQLTTLTPIIIIFALATLIFFFFYTRYKKRSRVLEKDQSETLRKLEEIKNIVIKNHIVLKDKTKIYIADLLYIKSDSHYLNLFLSDGKNHFVRGKLGQIKEELPPNFIQCHRSYIVNTNFIRQTNANTITLVSGDSIPLARSHKDKF